MGTISAAEHYSLIRSKAQTPRAYRPGHLVFTLTLARCDFGQHMHTQLAESTVLAAYAYHAASGFFMTEIAKSPRTQHH